ncbi:hypothetical protein ACO0LN_05965 [Undibacterium sp. TC9W]
MRTVLADFTAVVRMAHPTTFLTCNWAQIHANCTSYNIQPINP